MRNSLLFLFLIVCFLVLLPSLAFVESSSAKIMVEINKPSVSIEKMLVTFDFIIYNPQKTDFEGYVLWDAWGGGVKYIGKRIDVFVNSSSKKVYRVGIYPENSGLHWVQVKLFSKDNELIYETQVAFKVYSWVDVGVILAGISGVSVLIFEIYKYQKRRS